MSAWIYMQVTYEAQARKRLKNLLQEATDVLANQNGFLGMTKYNCLEENTLFALLEWESAEDFESCKRAPDWLVVMPDWSDLLEEQAAELTFKYCEPMA